MITKRLSRLLVVASASAMTLLLVPSVAARAAKAPVTPTISGFSPTIGWTTGGDTVTINGAGLARTTAVDFVPQAACGVAVKTVAASIVSASNSTVTVKTGPAAEGCYAIKVTTSTWHGRGSDEEGGSDERVGPHASAQTTALSSSTFQYSIDVDPTDPCVNLSGDWTRSSTEFSVAFGGQDSSATPELCKATAYTVDIRSANGLPLGWVTDPAHSSYIANTTVHPISATEIVLSLTGVDAGAQWQAAGVVNPQADVQFFVTATSPSLPNGSGQSDRAPELASGNATLDTGVAGISGSPGGSMN